MALEPTGVNLVAEGFDGFMRSMGAAGQAVVGFGDAAARTAGGALAGFATAAGAAAAVAGGALVAGLGAAATTGLSFNNAVEQAEARINAFTKDAAATAEILEMVRERAANTPFAFEEMAAAAAGLGPVAKSAGIPLEDLIAQAEILAASNPAEGLEGAVVALKEAASGDFVSAIERFNLSRSYINDLREQGVPDLEALSMAMQQAGYDADLVTALANTAAGRMSTFADTFTNLAGTVTQPIFDAFSAGMGEVNSTLSDGTPILEAAAKALGESLVPAAEWLGRTMVDTAAGLVQFVDMATNADGSLKSFGEIWATFGPAIQEGAAGALEAVGQFALDIGAKILEGLPGVVANLQALGARLLAWAAEQAPGWLASLAQLGAGLGQWVADAIPQVLGKLLDLRNQLVAWVLDSLPGWAAELDKLRTAAIEWVANALPDLGTNLGKITALLIEKTGEFIATTGPKLLELAGMFITWVATEALPRLPGEMVKIGTALVTGIGNFIAEVAPELIKLGQKFIDWVGTEVLPKAPGELAKIGSAIVEGIGSFLTNVDAEARKVGQAIIDGIKNAVTGAAGQIGSAVKTAAMNALAEAKKALGIQSPSRVFAAEVGQPISQGIALGIVGGAAFVDEAIGQTVTGGLAVAQEAAPSLGAAIIAGLSTAIGAEAPRALLAAQRVSDAILSAARQKLQIGSGQSRAFADDVGAPVVEGIAQGISAQATVIDDALGATIESGLSLAEQAAPGIGRAIGDGLAAGISAGVVGVSKAAQKLAQAATGGAKKELAIASPSQVFADEVGAPIAAGMAEGMLNNLDVLLDAAKEISWAVLDEAKAFAGTIRDAVAPLFAAAFEGAAQFARGQISALDALDSLRPDPADLDKIGQEGAKILEKLNGVGQEFADKRAKLEAELLKLREGVADDDAAAERKRLEDELDALEGRKRNADEDLAERRRLLAYTAANNIDPEKRAAAQRELDELDASGAASSPEELERVAAIKAELARLDERTAAQSAAAREAELKRIADLEAELGGLAAAEEARRAQLKAEADNNAARYAAEAARFEEQQRIADQAQRDIAAAQAEALKIEDPAERAAFLKLRTQQIIEQARLQQQIAGETNEYERARLEERMKLLTQAQQFETQLYAQQAQERQAQQAAALRDAEDAVKQLTNLIYFSQIDAGGIGSDVIKGIGAGMLSQLQALSGTLGGAFQGLLDNLKKALGIASPSRLFAEQIGAPLALGIAAGLQTELARVTPQITANVSGLVQPVARAAQFATTAPSFSDNRSISISAPGATPATVAQIRQVADGLMRQTTARSDLIRRTR